MGGLPGNLPPRGTVVVIQMQRHLSDPARCPNLAPASQVRLLRVSQSTGTVASIPLSHSAVEVRLLQPTVVGAIEAICYIICRENSEWL